MHLDMIMHLIALNSILNDRQLFNSLTIFTNIYYNISHVHVIYVHTYTYNGMLQSFNCVIT